MSFSADAGTVSMVQIKTFISKIWTVMLVSGRKIVLQLYCTTTALGHNFQQKQDLARHFNV